LSLPKVLTFITYFVKRPPSKVRGFTKFYKEKMSNKEVYNRNLDLAADIVESENTLEVDVKLIRRIINKILAAKLYDDRINSQGQV
jgi:hypothetical protein